MDRSESGRSPTNSADERAPSGDPASVASATSAAEANRAFGLSLYRRLAAQPGNVVLSPISLAGAFGPVAAGAQGETREAIGAVLGFPSDEAVSQRELGALLRASRSDSDGARVSIANALWLMRGLPIKQEFITAAERSYDAEVESLDFRNGVASARRINSWVEKETNGRIRNLVSQDSLDEMTALVVTNAVYFLGDWLYPFNAGSTQPQPFHLSDGTTRDVPLMQGKRRVRYAETDAVQILDLPYKGERLSMTIVLPKQRGGLGALGAQLNDERLADWLGRLDAANPQDVRLFIPKVKVETSYQLNQPLSDMGMGIAFDRNRANFRGMADRQLFISQVVHKAFLKIDEKGTEAAAATAVEVELTSAPPSPPPVFRADHPFLFLIRDRQTGAILFLGRIAVP